MARPDQHNVHVSGVVDGQPMVGAHGSDLSAYDPDRYGSLDGYAADVVELCELDFQHGVARDDIAVVALRVRQP
jgi:hypothetical protein